MFKKVLPLASIMFVRFFGLFIVLPVLSVYAMELPGATEMLIGLTFAGYSLAQMALVIPFGWLSDKIGRKRSIVIGLGIFGAGSLVCAFSDSIYMLLFGRILQGAGAISAVTSALISDIVREEQRTKAMAVVGMAIGLSTVLSMILGPIIAAKFDLSMLFTITFALVVIELLILLTLVPNPPKVHYTFTHKSTLRALLNHRPIMLMSLVNMFQKALIVAVFVIAPVLFVHVYGWDKADLIGLYIPAFIVSFFAMGLASMLADAKGKYRQVLLTSLSFFALAFFFLGIMEHRHAAFFGVVLFFIGFNMLEPMMQTLITKYAKAHERGKVLGLFNGFGFLGSALGGLLGGVAIMEGMLEGVALFIILASGVFLFFARSMHNPARLKNLYLSKTDTTQLVKLEQEGKIVEWYRNDTEGLTIVKYDTGYSDEAVLKASLGAV